jgi:pilus assembly protein CpaE
LLAPHPLRFRYLACPNQEFDSKGFDYNIGHTMVHELRKVGQFVIIDTGFGMSEPTVAAADNSDLIFLITSRDVARLLATQRFIKFLKERECPTQKIKVLVNEAEVGGEIPEAEIESLLEHPVTAYLPSNAGPVAYSINSGVPIVVSQPEQPISVVLSKLAEYTLNRWQPKAESGQAAKPKSLAAKLSQRLR